MITLSRLCREPLWRDFKCLQRLWWHPPQRVNPSNCRHHGWTPGQEILPYLRHDMDKSQEKDKDPNFRSHRLPVVFLPCRFKVPGMEHMTGLMLLLLLSRFSRVRLCATPETAAYQAPPSLGFSRQEHWSGLPFPSPMHEREKCKWSRSVMSDS